jgi:hypothetical protein
VPYKVLPWIPPASALAGSGPNVSSGFGLMRGLRKANSDAASAASLSAISALRKTRSRVGIGACPFLKPYPVVPNVRHLDRLSTELLGQIHNVAGLEMFLRWMR